MMGVDRHLFAFSLAFVCGCLAPSAAPAQNRVQINTSADNLMVVLRESFGANKQDEVLVPFGKLRTRLPDGREVDFRMAAFDYLGDMHVRFVFDGPRSMQVAQPDDLSRLSLTPDAALALAVSNIKRVYGSPAASPWKAGLMQVQGQSPDLDSSYFLDRDFWRGLLERHPEGLVAAVPKRGGLVFTPMSNRAAVETLREGVAYLHSSSGHLRVSSALYFFKDGHWTVFQAPATANPP
jgi:hypothetical protein